VLRRHLSLDEIGDMPPPLQAKMLRVLQEQRFERVGGDRTIQTDVRIIAVIHPFNRYSLCATIPPRSAIRAVCQARRPK
jgi:transcriptional regulator of aromatic amino acid metabolism